MLFRQPEIFGDLLGQDNSGGLICAFSGRSSGNMSLSYGDTGLSLENRKDFLGALGIDHRDLVCARQIHGDGIQYARETDLGKGALSQDNAIGDKDAMITDRKNVPLSIFTADCLPVFLCDPKVPAIGLIHAGWRGSRRNITLRTVKMMKEEFKSKEENLYAGLGPCIRSCCYEVGRELNDYFGQEYVLEKQGRYFLDLPGINKAQLLNSGLKNKNIFDGGACTVCRNTDFFSFRKEGNGCGRIMSVMMLTDG
ncbi:MAG: peptidoglycan editing factor PgeF [Candidatus Omnitrophica bacterium]|nr:peptidoglycan editing factor PgeF [Candidatus Omnitrophota bacterium]